MKIGATDVPATTSKRSPRARRYREGSGAPRESDARTATPETRRIRKNAETARRRDGMGRPSMRWNAPRAASCPTAGRKGKLFRSGTDGLEGAFDVLEGFQDDVGLRRLDLLAGDETRGH